MTAPGRRDTSIEWLESLPAHWEQRNLGRDVWVRARLGWRGLTADEYVDSGVPMLSTPDIKGAEIDYSGASRITRQRYEESPEIMLAEGDVLLTKDGSTIGTVNLVRQLPEAATVNGSIALLTPSAAVDGRFLYWYIASQHAQSLFDRLRGGMGVPHLFQRDINRITYPAPPLSEQRAIADYLDRETAQIDTLIEEQQRLLGLLVERRQAVIDKAFEPATANATRVLRLLRHRPSYGVLKPDYVNAESGSVSLIRVGDILRLHEPPQLPQISSAQSAEYARTELVGGEIVLGVVGKLGQAAVVPHDVTPANTNRPVAVLRCRDEVAAELLALWFRTTEFHRQATEATAGDSIQPTLGMKDLSSFTVSWPARPAEALESLRHELSSIANLADSASQCVALTQERRSALITAAVTGQVAIPS